MAKADALPDTYRCQARVRNCDVAPYRKPTVPRRSNDHYAKTQDRLDFIAPFGSIVLTFLAGIEVDPAYRRRRLGASLGIGVVSWRQGNQ
jgi:hypothetical protein